MVNIRDDFADKTLKKAKISNNKTNLNYDFESIKRVPIKISSLENITTKNGIKEGQELQFKVLKDVKLENERIIKKDSIVKARLETISPNQAFGVPADMVVDKFIIKQQNQADLILDGNVHKIGANRSLWVYPVGYVGGILFFGAGFLLFTVRGGHAKIKTKDVYEVYYLPKSF